MSPILGDIIGLSSGTLASLSGFRDYETLDMIQLDLVTMYQLAPHLFQTWMDVWRTWHHCYCRQQNIGESAS